MCTIAFFKFEAPVAVLLNHPPDPCSPRALPRKQKSSRTYIRKGFVFFPPGVCLLSRALCALCTWRAKAVSSDVQDVDIPRVHDLAMGNNYHLRVPPERDAGPLITFPFFVSIHLSGDSRFWGGRQRAGGGVSFVEQRHVHRLSRVLRKRHQVRTRTDATTRLRRLLFFLYSVLFLLLFFFKLEVFIFILHTSTVSRPDSRIVVCALATLKIS